MHILIMESKNDRLRIARVEAGYSEASLAAQALGVPSPTYTSHENGTRGFKDDSAEKYARRFGVSVEWLIYGRGPQKLKRKGGFSEASVQPIDMSSYKKMLDHSEVTSSSTPFAVTIGLPEAGILNGALILVDIKSQAKDGDIVVATRDDREIGTSETMLRRLVGTHLVGPLSEDILQIDETITIRGKVIQAINSL